MTAQLGIPVAVTLLLLAAAGDIASRSVPNWLSLAVAADGLALRAQGGALSLSLMAALAVFLAAALCWRRGFMGGGDVKLLAAVSLLVAPRLVPALVLLVAGAGGALGVTYYALRLLLRAPSKGRPHARLMRILRVEHYRIARGFALPYAAAIAVGGLCSLLRT